MRALLAIVAASAALVLPAPAVAEGFGDSGFVAVSGGSSFHGDFGRRHRDRGADTVLVYDREYQGNSAWKSDSFNDWWHEQPERAYPRWMGNNRKCERMWWSGGGWTC